MSLSTALAARAFERTLEELESREDALDLGDPAALGRRAALLAAAEAVWGLQLGPLFDVDQVKGSQTPVTVAKSLWVLATGQMWRTPEIGQRVNRIATITASSCNLLPT